jgi:hypothetical protein
MDTTTFLENINNLVVRFIYTIPGVEDHYDIEQAWRTGSIETTSIQQVLQDYTTAYVKATKKAKKAKKDPAAPKGQLSAYMFFCKENRANVLFEHPDMKATDVLKELGRRWRAIKDDTDMRKTYDTQAANDKIRYQSEKASYVQTSDTESSSSTKSKKTKRARTAYNYFCSETRQLVKEEYPEMTNSEILSELGRRWSNIKNTEESTRFHEAAVADKEAKEEEAKEEDEEEAKEEVKEEEVKVLKSKKTRRTRRTRNKNAENIEAS